MSDIGHNSRPDSIDQAVDEVERLGLIWADADAAAEALEDSRKSVFAECLLAVADAKSVGEREARASIDPRYERHLKALEVGRKTRNRARVSFDVMKIRIEIWRTKSATQRAAMNLR